MADERSGVDGDASGDPAAVVLKEPRDRAYWARRFEVPVRLLLSALALRTHHPGQPGSQAA